ncbi:putative tartrate transporter [compost metagenome]
MQQANESLVMRKIFVRIVPLLMSLYVLSYIDRINVSFAALTMNADLGISAYAYGWGAGIFFIGYCLFEVPSNLMLVKFGARKWIARILFSWGILACAMAWVQGPTSFLVLRFLLGAAEAGFFPGVVLYLTYWFPARYRGRIIAAFMLSIPLSLAVGAPLSTALLHLDGILGFKGWQWLFMIEGLPTVLMTAVVLACLPDSPAKAKWLRPEEQAWLEAELRKDTQTQHEKPKSSLAAVFKDPAVLLLCFIYFCATASNLGLSFFLPQIVKGQGYSTTQTGLISALPYVFGCVGMLLIGNLSDRWSERKWLLTLSLVIAASGLGLAGWLGASVAAIAALCFATIGIMGCKGPFWPIPAAKLQGPAAAAGIALINSLGNLGGFAGPYLVGWAKESTGHYESGLFALAALTFSAALLTALLVRNPTTRGPTAQKMSGNEVLKTR